MKPTPEAQTGKRIVSKREYVKRQAKRTGIGTVAGSLLAVSVVTAVFSLLCLTWIVLVMVCGNYSLPLVQTLCLLLGFAAIALVTFRYGLANLRRAMLLDTGVPLTRANTAALPAPDTLVRASAEPRQAQEAMLLRASVGETQERSEEAGQLLRASAGGQEGC